MITLIVLEVPNRFLFVFATLEVMRETVYEAKLYSTTFWRMMLREACALKSVKNGSVISSQIHDKFKGKKW